MPPLKVDTIEHDERYREHHTGREFSPGEGVVGQASMDAAIAILIRMDIHKAKYRRRRLQDRIKRLSGSPVAGTRTSQKPGKDDPS